MCSFRTGTLGFCVLRPLPPPPPPLPPSLHFISAHLHISLSFCRFFFYFFWRPPSQVVSASYACLRPYKVECVSISEVAANAENRAQPLSSTTPFPDPNDFTLMVFLFNRSRERKRGPFMPCSFQWKSEAAETAHDCGWAVWLAGDEWWSFVTRGSAGVCSTAKMAARLRSTSACPSTILEEHGATWQRWGSIWTHYISKFLVAVDFDRLLNGRCDKAKVAVRQRGRPRCSPQQPHKNRKDNWVTVIMYEESGGLRVTLIYTIRDQAFI